LKIIKIGQSAAKYISPKKENKMFKQYYNTSYDIYSDGRCYSHLSDKFLSPQMTNTYPTYNLTINGKKKKIKVHRMVAEMFLPKIEGKNIVNHIDGNTHNFVLSNLEWVTEKENSQHAIKLGLRKKGNQTINKYIKNLPQEQWKMIKDYPNYLISSFGRVMNINTKRLLKQYEDNAGGYLVVNLWKKGKNKKFRIHALVYTQFKNDCDLEGFVINHIDGNKKNNKIDNLEKTTYQKNNLHAVYEIKTNNCCKEIVQLDNDFNIISKYPSINVAQKELHISNISRAIRKKQRAGGYYWKFGER
jgi:hypothetical protein